MIKDTLFILDLDRTLVDVSKVMRITELVCQELGIGFEAINKQQSDLYAKGKGYSPLEHIAKQPNVEIELFNRRFCELAGDNELFFPDAARFIDQLKHKKYDFIILTYGVDARWQTLKLQATQLINHPHLIVKERYKSRIISGWIKDGILSPGTQGLGTYKNCVFMDDRQEAFDGFPELGKGFLIDRLEYFRDIQTLPPNVRVMKSIDEFKFSPSAS